MNELNTDAKDVKKETDGQDAMKNDKTNGIMVENGCKFSSEISIEYHNRNGTLKN
jgi:hypothetical protein